MCSVYKEVYEMEHLEQILQGKHEARVTESRRAVAKVFPSSAAKLRTDTNVLTAPSAKLRTETKKV